MIPSDSCRFSTTFAYLLYSACAVCCGFGADLAIIVTREIENMSYLVEVSVEDLVEEGALVRLEDGVRVATKEEADRHAHWVSTTWTWILETHIVESTDPVNCIVNERGHVVLQFSLELLHPEIGMWREIGVVPAPLEDVGD
jgi:hypothetical protein